MAQLERKEINDHRRYSSPAVSLPSCNSSMNPSEQTGHVYSCKDNEWTELGTLEGIQTECTGCSIDNFAKWSGKVFPGAYLGYVGKLLLADVAIEARLCPWTVLNHGFSHNSQCPAATLQLDFIRLPRLLAQCRDCTLGGCDRGLTRRLSACPEDAQDQQDDG